MDGYDAKLGIKAWAEEDRPREKLLDKGRRALTDAELIAILIGSGSRDESAVELSKRILHHYKNDLHALGKASVEELSKFKGIGEAKAISIIAALELGRRRQDTDVKVLDKIKTSGDARQLLKRHFADLQHEEFWILLLSRASTVLGTHLISKGGLASTPADPKIIFKVAIEKQASTIILAHNHPSGNVKPSADDISLTKKMVAAGKLLDITVADHLIFTDQEYFSFNDAELL